LGGKSISLWGDLVIRFRPVPLQVCKGSTGYITKCDSNNKCKQQQPNHRALPWKISDFN
jgi:hypothetical protein